MELAYSFRDSVIIIIIMAEDCSVQAEMMLEKELKVLHLEPQATGSELCSSLGVA